MGKRNFAVSAKGDQQTTEMSRYGNDLNVWVRGWERGIEIECKKIDGVECFEIHLAGGSNAKSNGYGKIVEIKDGLVTLYE